MFYCFHLFLLETVEADSGSDSDEDDAADCAEAAVVEGMKLSKINFRSSHHHILFYSRPMYNNRI